MLSVQNTLKFSLTPSTLASYTLKLSKTYAKKKKKKRENCRSRPGRAEKLVIFVSPRGFAPPLEKFLRAPMTQLHILCNVFVFRNPEGN